LYPSNSSVTAATQRRYFIRPRLFAYHVPSRCDKRQYGTHLNPSLASKRLPPPRQTAGCAHDTRGHHRSLITCCREVNCVLLKEDPPRYENRGALPSHAQGLLSYCGPPLPPHSCRKDHIPKTPLVICAILQWAIGSDPRDRCAAKESPHAAKRDGLPPAAHANAHTVGYPGCPCSTAFKLSGSRTTGGDAHPGSAGKRYAPSPGTPRIINSEHCFAM